MTTLWNALNAIYISILSTDFRFNSLFFRSLSHVSECQLWCIEFVLSRSAGISHLVTHTIGEHSRNSSHDHVFRISIKKTKCGVASYQSTQIAIPKWIAILNRCQSLRNLKLRQQLNSIWFAAFRSLAAQKWRTTNETKKNRRLIGILGSAEIRKHFEVKKKIRAIGLVLSPFSILFSFELSEWGLRSRPQTTLCSDSKRYFHSGSICVVPCARSHFSMNKNKMNVRALALAPTIFLEIRSPKSCARKSFVYLSLRCTVIAIKKRDDYIFFIINESYHAPHLDCRPMLTILITE